MRASPSTARVPERGSLAMKRPGQSPTPSKNPNNNNSDVIDNQNSEGGGSGRNSVDDTASDRARSSGPASPAIFVTPAVRVDSGNSSSAMGTSPTSSAATFTSNSSSSEQSALSSPFSSLSASEKGGVPYKGMLPLGSSAAKAPAAAAAAAAAAAVVLPTQDWFQKEDEVSVVLYFKQTLESISKILASSSSSSPSSQNSKNTTTLTTNDVDVHLDSQALQVSVTLGSKLYRLLILLTHEVAGVKNIVTKAQNVQVQLSKAASTRWPSLGTVMINVVEDSQAVKFHKMVLQSTKEVTHNSKIFTFKVQNHEQKQQQEQEQDEGGAEMAKMKCQDDDTNSKNSTSSSWDGAVACGCHVRMRATWADEAVVRSYTPISYPLGAQVCVCVCVCVRVCVDMLAAQMDI